MPHKLSRFIAFPYPHFMAFAPLDVWARLLFAPAVWISPRYWLRLAFVLFTSFLGTIASLPERIILGVVLRIAASRSGTKLNHKPGVVVILGYFRSGTTHLHYLLSCDPNFRTPAWCETLVPQGFRFSWVFLRLFMIPWISSRRPQDDMAFGPSWPGEDDFALNNWAAASSLPWRFILPREYAHYSRFHSLEGLTARERARWRFCQFAFCWKIARLARRRTLLLKSPSHIARVRALLEVFGPENVKCVHISRDPGAVVRSNVAMFERMSVYGLQDPLPPESVRPLIAQEYVESERRYLQDLALIPAGHIAEVRYEDLVADPLGQVKHIYDTLGLTPSPEFERHALAYLNSAREYRAVSPPTTPPPQVDSREIQDDFRSIASRFGHDRPAIGAVPVPPGGLEPRERGEAKAIALACTTAIALALLWMIEAYVLRARNDWFVWPVGMTIGFVSIAAARVGTRRLGFIAGLLTFLAFAIVIVPNSFLEEYAHRPNYYQADGTLIPWRQWEWYHIFKHTKEHSLATHNVFWVFMGCMSAYRFASRRYVNPPGSV